MENQKRVPVQLWQIEEACALYAQALATGCPRATKDARLTLYLHHGWPLGGTVRGVEMWAHFGVSTTAN